MAFNSETHAMFESLVDELHDALTTNDKIMNVSISWATAEVDKTAKEVGLYQSMDHYHEAIIEMQGRFLLGLVAHYIRENV